MRFMAQSWWQALGAELGTDSPILNFQEYFLSKVSCSFDDEKFSILKRRILEKLWDVNFLSILFIFKSFS